MRAGWDLNTAVRPELESLGLLALGTATAAAAVTVTHQIPASDPGPETLQ